MIAAREPAPAPPPLGELPGGLPGDAQAVASIGARIAAPSLFVVRAQLADLRRQIAECRALLEAYRREVDSW
jgi:hypothetical protein